MQTVAFASAVRELSGIENVCFIHKEADKLTYISQGLLTVNSGRTFFRVDWVLR